MKRGKEAAVGAGGRPPGGGAVNPVESIHVRGAREHNLRDVEVRVPRGRLVAVTGVSGSGKTSLVFDTLYAEGYRKYMESLSARARQAMEQLKRPDVDFIHGLSPVLAIEQRAANASPRSTLATATEIADYARLLWTLQGEQRCPKDGGRIERQTLDGAVDRTLALPRGARAMLLAPWMRAKPAQLREELPRLRQKGYQRVRLSGEVVDLDDRQAAPAGRAELDLEIVIDRLTIDPGQRSRLADSLELAFSEGKDRAVVLYQRGRDAPWDELTLSLNLACETCGEVYEPIGPRHFSFNTVEGACPECDGLGKARLFSEDLMVPDPSKSVRNGAIKPLRLGGKNLIARRNALLKQLAEQLPFDPTVPWEQLDDETRQAILFGVEEPRFYFKLGRGKREAGGLEPFPGVVALLEKAMRETKSEGYRARLTAFQRERDCPLCGGRRFSPRIANVFVGGRSLPDFFAFPVDEALQFTQNLDTPLEMPAVYGEARGGIEQRLRFLSQVGLDYLTLDRPYGTLSGGEAQRARLATQLGMSLIGVVYALDEPSIGLHARDNARLIRALEELRDRGNTVVVVEHDEDAIRAADHLIELGPGAGSAGGRVLFEGPPEACLRAGEGPTAAYLSGRQRLSREAKPKVPDGRWLEILQARARNLRRIDARFPVGLFVCVAGVSGSGKSTLVNEILAKAAARALNRSKDLPGAHGGVRGLEHFERVARVTQEPIGQSPRSNPATYTKLFDLLRELFAKVPLSRVRGYKPSRFSFNARGGRCERCQGQGAVKLDMLFLGDAYVECPSCRGRRYNRETLEARFGGKNIAEVLEMSVGEAMVHFRNVPRVMEKLATLDAVGLGYLKLGQPANTLSGGEAQRLKLSLELSKRQQGRSLYILDEPTTGLHWADIQHLLDLLFRLRDQGNTIAVIEHHLDVIGLADWVLELGPEGGERGGEIVYEGSPSGLPDAPGSPTGQALAARRASRGGGAASGGWS